MIVVRSLAEMRDAQIVEAHTEVCALLNEMCCGRCLYTGNARAALVALRTKLESVVLGNAEWDFTVSPQRHIYAAISTR